MQQTTTTASTSDRGDPPIPGGVVRAWAIWDWATQPFNTVILTFVWVSLYLVSDAFLPPEIARSNANGSLNCAQAVDAATAYCQGLANLSSHFGWVTFAAGLIVLAIAPVLGQRADANGSKKRWVVGATIGLALAQFLLCFVYAEPALFWFGAITVALGSVIAEIANVSYYAMLFEVSTARTVGRVSGLGWGLGYLGGIVALVIVVIVTQFEWFGLDISNGLAYRLIAAGAAVWTILFALPFFFVMPESSVRVDRPKVNFFRSYLVLARDLRALFRDHRPTFGFLIASAVYRDGIAGVFAFGAILAAVSFGFSTTEVMMFGIALNLVAGVATILIGLLEHRVGPRTIIAYSLIILLLSMIFIFVFREQGKPIFWIGGLILSATVGPAQASSRSMLAQMAPAHMQGEIFGLYATTGRVMSFLSPALWAGFIIWLGATHFGILGLIIVVALGVVLLYTLVPLHAGQRHAASPTSHDHRNQRGTVYD